jgi:hypothetical protein
MTMRFAILIAPRFVGSKSDAVDKALSIIVLLFGKTELQVSMWIKCFKGVIVHSFAVLTALRQNHIQSFVSTRLL